MFGIFSRFTDPHSKGPYFLLTMGAMTALGFITNQQVPNLFIFIRQSFFYCIADIAIFIVLIFSLRFVIPSAAYRNLLACFVAVPLFTFGLLYLKPDIITIKVPLANIYFHIAALMHGSFFIAFTADQFEAEEETKERLKNKKILATTAKQHDK